MGDKYQKDNNIYKNKLLQLANLQTGLWYLIFLCFESVFLYGTQSFLSAEISYLLIISVSLVVLAIDYLSGHYFYFFLRPKASYLVFNNLPALISLVFGGFILFLIFINYGNSSDANSFGVVGSVTLCLALPIVFYMYLSVTRITKGAHILATKKDVKVRLLNIEPYIIVFFLALFGILFDFLPQQQLILLLIPLAILITCAIFNMLLNKLSVAQLKNLFKNRLLNKKDLAKSEAPLFELSPFKFQAELSHIFKGQSEENKINAVNSLKSIAAIDYIPLLQAELDKSETYGQAYTILIEDVLKYLINLEEAVDAIENPYEFVEQTSETEVIKALLRKQIAKPDKNLIIKLLNDNRESVVKSACSVAGYFDDINFISLLVEKLNNPKISIYARFALKNIGSKVIKYLEIEFSKNRGNLFFTEACFDVLSELEAANAHDLLFSSLNDSNKNIVRIAAKKLIPIYEKPDIDKRKYFDSLFNNLILNTLTNIFIIENIKNENETFNPLRTAFNNENKDNILLIKKLTQLYYNTEAIEEIISLLDNDSIQGHALVNNLIDIHFRKNLDLSNKIKILFSPSDYRLREYLLEEFPDFEFDISFKNKERLIWQILNMDYDKVSSWTRATAINTLMFLDTEDVPFELATEFLNQNQLMQESAAICLYKHFPEFYTIYLNRLHNDDAVKLDFKVRSNTSGEIKQGLRVDNLLLYNKIQFLSGITYLKELTVNEISTFESFFKPIVLQAGDHQINSNDERLMGFWIVESGSAVFSNDGLQFLPYYKKDIFEVLPTLTRSGQVYFSLEKPARFLVIEKIVLFNILRDSYNIIFENLEEVTEFSSNLQAKLASTNQVA